MATSKISPSCTPNQGFDSRTNLLHCNPLARTPACIHCFSCSQKFTSSFCNRLNFNSFWNNSQWIMLWNLFLHTSDYLFHLFKIFSPFDLLHVGSFKIYHKAKPWSYKMLQNSRKICKTWLLFSNLPQEEDSPLERFLMTASFELRWNTGVRFEVLILKTLNFVSVWIWTFYGKGLTVFVKK